MVTVRRFSKAWLSATLVCAVSAVAISASAANGTAGSASAGRMLAAAEGSSPIPGATYTGRVSTPNFGGMDGGSISFTVAADGSGITTADHPGPFYGDTLGGSCRLTFPAPFSFDPPLSVGLGVAPQAPAAFESFTGTSQFTGGGDDYSVTFWGYFTDPQSARGWLDFGPTSGSPDRCYFKSWEWTATTTAVPAPSVSTGAASNVAVSTATVAGTVNPEGFATGYRFDYGTTSAYGSSTAVADAGAGTGDVSVTASLTGLTAHTTYHYRLVALRGSSVAATGADRTFTTQQLPANTSLPKISGKPTPGAQLTCSAGSWTEASSFAYAWLRDGTAMAGKTATTLRPGSGDLGHDFACRVTAGNAYGSATATSAAVRIVDLAPPRLTALKSKPKAFKAARSGGSIARHGKTGTLIRFRLSEQAIVTFRIEKALHGRKVRGRCVAPSKNNRRAKACIRYKVLRGKFEWSGTAGRNAFRFTGRVNRHRLARGTYRLRATAKDPSGNLARSRQVRFTIK